MRGATLLRGLVLAATLASTAPAFAVTPDEILPDPQLEARARVLSHELRCMVCQNQSIDDSDAPLAHQQTQVARQRRLGVVDRLVLAHHAAQLARQVARPGLLRRVGHDLVRLHGMSGRKPDGRQNNKAGKKTSHSDYSAGCNPRSAFAGLGTPTRRRRSDSESTPPIAISTGPNQIRSTSGLW